MAPATPGPDPDFDCLGAFPKVAKRFWPLQPPIGLRLGPFAITRRGLADPLDEFGLKRLMARDRHPAFSGFLGFWFFGLPALALLYPYLFGVGHAY